MHTNESKETQIQRWDLKRWVLRSFLNWLSLLASLISEVNEFQIYGAQCLNAFSVHFLLALGGIFNRFWEPDLNRRLGTYCSKRLLKYDGALLFNTFNAQDADFVVNPSLKCHYNWVYWWISLVAFHTFILNSPDIIAFVMKVGQTLVLIQLAQWM